MKTTYIKLSLATILLIGIYSCKKGEATVSDYEVSTSADSAAVSKEISSVATMKVKDKQFIKTAGVNMEVKDVYEATISIEKSVQDLGGFVTNSNLRSNVLSEDSYNLQIMRLCLSKNIKLKTQCRYVFLMKNWVNF